MSLQWEGVLGVIMLAVALTSGQFQEQSESSGRPRQSVNTRPRKTDKPNIVFIITDDQDVELGSLNYMPKAARWLRDAGATFTNAFITTPMCCPSRSSMLTGMYVHNHFTYTNNDNCSSENWRLNYETRNFGTFLTDAGYRTGYFGKYLNEYTGAHIPPGWTEWMGLIRNTRFYNYSVNYNGQKIKHEDNYYKDYLTDLIANDSVRFLRDSKNLFPSRPVAMVLSMPAPHGPEDAAPQYQHLFTDEKSHRTPSWNFAPNPDKQWLLQYTGKMTPIQIAFTDLLHTKRLQTLQSVDDAVEKVCQELEALGELNNTYIIYTSDHGYHLGQYGLVKGKAMPYEFDIRVPFYMRGPKINPGTRMPNIVLNLDIAPTLLDIAGVVTPDHMDGSSVLKLFDGHQNSFGGVRRRRVWRDTFLVERGKLTGKKLKVQEKLEARVNRLVITKDQRLENECQKPEYQAPCKQGQQWECRRNDEGKLRVYKCRTISSTVNSNQASSTASTPVHVDSDGRCTCPRRSSPLDRPKIEREMQRQLEFLHHHVNKPMLEPRFILERYRRDVRTARAQPVTVSPSPLPSTSLPTVYGNKTYSELPNIDADAEANNDETFFVPTPSPLDTKWITLDSDHVNDTAIPCRIIANGSVTCERFVYTGIDEWNAQKSKIEQILHSYNHRLSVLQRIYKHLLESQPTSARQLAIRHPVILTTLPTATITDASRMASATPSPYKVEELNANDRELRVKTKAESDDEDVDQDEDCTCEDEDAIGEEVTTQNAASKNRRLEALARQIATQDEREKHRKLKTEKRRSSRRSKNGKTQPVGKVAQAPFDCSSPDVSCSETSTATELPFGPGTEKQPVSPWDGVDPTRFSPRRDPACNIEGLECTRMDDEHWKVPPYWTHGPFCICPNSNNNTYWCLRTVNESHNFLYCEFITGFISFYDMTRDPNQLRNAVHDLSFGVLHQLHDTLEFMKGCKGRKCNHRHKAAGFDTDERNNWKSVGKQISDTSKVNGGHTDVQRWLRTRSIRHGRS